MARPEATLVSNLVKSLLSIRFPQAGIQSGSSNWIASETGNRPLLQLFYPQHSSFSLQLASGLQLQLPTLQTLPLRGEDQPPVTYIPVVSTIFC